MKTMSMISVHGPTTSQPFYAQSEFIIVNLLGEGRVEVKSPLRFGLAKHDPAPYEWDFGDGNRVMDGYEVTHTFGAPGEKTVTVKINTEDGVVEDSLSFTLPGDGGNVQAIQPKRARRRAA